MGIIGYTDQPNAASLIRERSDIFAEVNLSIFFVAWTSRPHFESLFDVPKVGLDRRSLGRYLFKKPFCKSVISIDVFALQVLLAKRVDMPKRVPEFGEVCQCVFADTHLNYVQHSGL